MGKYSDVLTTDSLLRKNIFQLKNESQENLENILSDYVQKKGNVCIAKPYKMADLGELVEKNEACRAYAAYLYIFQKSGEAYAKRIANIQEPLLSRVRSRVRALCYSSR